LTEQLLGYKKGKGLILGIAHKEKLMDLREKVYVFYGLYFQYVTGFMGEAR
jgi:hypothetical protein